LAHFADQVGHPPRGERTVCAGASIIEGMRGQRYGNAMQDLARLLTTTRQPEMQDRLTP
jgi:hypothetical protein